MSDVPLGHFVRMVIAGSRVGARLLPLREIRLLEDDETRLRKCLFEMRRAGLSSVTVEESTRWAALLLYAFGRCSAVKEFDENLFGEVLRSDELSLLKSGHQLWVRVGVAGSERELVALTTSTECATRGPNSGRHGIAVGQATSIEWLLRSIIRVSPTWSTGKSLRRLVVTAADEIEFERVLGVWFWRDVDQLPLAMGAAFFLYGSRVFARETRYSYDTLARRLGVSTLGERVAMRYREIEKGTAKYFGISLSGGPEGYVERMLLHSGGGWDHVAEVVESLDRAVFLERQPSWNQLSDELMLLPKRREVSGGLRAMLREPPTRAFLNKAIRLLAAACREKEPADRTPVWLGDVLDIASEDARRRIFNVVGTPKRVTVAPAASKLSFHLRAASGEMPRVVVALPHTMEWPTSLPAVVERFRLFVRGEARSRPVVYAREGAQARRQGVIDHLELPDAAVLPIDVVLESDQGAQDVFERLALPDAVTVFDVPTGRPLDRMPRAGEIALVGKPGTQFIGEWGRELPSRSGIIVRVGELGSDPVELVIRRSDGSEEPFFIEPARPLPTVSLEGVLDTVAFGRGGRVALRPPKVHCLSSPGAPARVSVEGCDSTRALDVPQGQEVQLPVGAPGVYRIQLHANARPRRVIFAPQARFTAICDGAQLVLEAMWAPTEPAVLRVGEKVGSGSLILPLEGSETISVRVDPPSFARDVEAVRWTVTAHPRHVEVASEPRGHGLASPVLERLRYGGGLRVYGNPREEVTVEPGYYRRRTFCLDARGEGFLPFAHLDESELEHDLGQGQLIVQVTWKNPHRRVELRIAREGSVRLNARLLRGTDGIGTFDVDVPAGVDEPLVETLPLWKPWEGWTRLPPAELRPAEARGVAVQAPVSPGPYLCAVSDASDPERRLRALPRAIYVDAPDTDLPSDELERCLWNRERGREDITTVLAAFERRLEREGDELLDGLLRLFERSGTAPFTIGAVVAHGLGARRLIARANHACGRATAVELRLLALCDQERVPWSVVPRKDVEAFVRHIAEWDLGAFTIAVEAACSARAGIGFWLQQCLPDDRTESLTPHLPRLVSCWTAPASLTLEERDRVVSEAEMPPDEDRARVATLYDARRKLAAGTIRLERLRIFARAAPFEARMDAHLVDLDSSLSGLAERITLERLSGRVSNEVVSAARYAERTVPRLYEFWLESMAAKHHQSEGTPR